MSCNGDGEVKVWVDLAIMMVTLIKVFNIGDNLPEVFLFGWSGWEIWGNLNSVNGGAELKFGCGMFGFKRVRIAWFYMTWLLGREQTSGSIGGTLGVEQCFRLY